MAPSEFVAAPNRCMMAPVWGIFVAQRHVRILDVRNDHKKEIGPTEFLRNVRFMPELLR